MGLDSPAHPIESLSISFTHGNNLDVLRPSPSYVPQGGSIPNIVAGDFDSTPSLEDDFYYWSRFQFLLRMEII